MVNYLDVFPAAVEGCSSVDVEPAPDGYPRPRDTPRVGDGWLEAWRTPRMRALDARPLPDYFTTDLAYRVVSHRLRTLLESERSASDEIQWLDVRVVDSTGNDEPGFSIMHFPHRYESVLHEGRTTRGHDGRANRHVLDGQRAKTHRVFSFHSTTFVVAAEVAGELVGGDFTGMKLVPMPEATS